MQNLMAKMLNFQHNVLKPQKLGETKIRLSCKKNLKKKSHDKKKSIFGYNFWRRPRFDMHLKLAKQKTQKSKTLNNTCDYVVVLLIYYPPLFLAVSSIKPQIKNGNYGQKLIQKLVTNRHFV